MPRPRPKAARRKTSLVKTPCPKPWIIHVPQKQWTTSPAPTSSKTIRLTTQRLAPHHEKLTEIANCLTSSQAPIPSEPDQKQREVPIDQAHSSNAPNAPQTPRPRHVLLVEDNFINRKIVCRKLQNKGYDVTTANDGQEALEMVIEAPGLSTGDSSAFDICLMDMEMPRMDGNAATRAIREREKQNQTDYLPILGVTANVRSGQQSEM
jgi:CheY-like chemotaxis protein